MKYYHVSYIKRTPMGYLGSRNVVADSKKSAIDMIENKSDDRTFYEVTDVEEFTHVRKIRFDGSNHYLHTLIKYAHTPFSYCTK